MPHWNLGVQALIQALIFMAGVVGQAMVARRSSLGFYFWIVSNALMLWTQSHAQPLQLGSLSLYVYYLLMCFYSIYQWRRLDHLSTPSSHPPTPALRHGWSVHVRSASDWADERTI